MSDNSSQTTLQDASVNSQCQMAGYLPVPLRNIPFESLKGLSLYLFVDNGYTLYRNKNLVIHPEDISRLLETNTEYAYVPVKDHQSYYQAIEQGLGSIVSDPNTQQEKKAEILYSTCIALVDQLYESPPEEAEINRVKNVSHALVEMVLQDKESFKHLFNVSNHDFYTATHMVNVCTTLVALGQHMRLSKEELQELGTGALLHDIGKLFIPKYLLNTEEKLTDDEFKLIQSHVDEGVNYLKKHASLSPIAMSVISEHHERLDGSGYPKGLKENHISLYGRMAGVVDTYEAMTSVRPYRSKAFSLEDVTSILHEEAVVKYDEHIINEFCDMIKKGLLPDTAESDAEIQKYCLPEESVVKRFKRVYFRMQMIVRVIEKVGDQCRVGPEKKMIVHNMSLSGIALLSPRPIKSGQNIHIAVGELDGQPMKPLIAVVIRCQDHGDGWYTVGSKFLQPPTSELLDKIKSTTAVMEEIDRSE